MTAKLVSIVSVLFAIAAAHGAEVRSPNYPHGVLFMLANRTAMAVNGNANAHPGLLDTSIDVKDKESFQQGCAYISSNQSWVNGLVGDFNSPEARQAMPDRTKILEKLGRVLKIGQELAAHCQKDERSKAAEMVAKLSDQRALIGEVKELIPEN